TRRDGSAAPLSADGATIPTTASSRRAILAVRDDAQNRPGGDGRIGRERQTAAVGDQAPAGGDAVCFLGAPGAYGVEGRRTGRDVQARRVHENTHDLRHEQRNLVSLRSEVNRIDSRP